MSLDDEGSKRFLNQVLSIWVKPDIELRKSAGTLPSNFALSRAQVILYPDGKYVVRLNDEVKALAKIRAARKFEAGEVYQIPSIDDIEDVDLSPDDSPDASHVTLFFQGRVGRIFFDFRRNRGLAKERYQAALQFLEAAEFCVNKMLLRPFIDCLFSAAELLASSQLFLFADPKYVKKGSHGQTHSQYNLRSKLGIGNQTYVTTFNKLSSMRTSARYLKGPIALSESDAREYLKAVQEMADYTKRFIS